MLSDIEIARKAKIKHIEEIAETLGISNEFIERYGKYKAKISLKFINKIKNRKNGKLILVTAMSPTKAGEGKTTTTIGLGQALVSLGKKALICIREPSMGPCMGIKGGAAGGGYSQVIPMEDINLHFTGDIHAITAAHNLLAAMVDNHIHQGNELDINPEKIVWKRVMDMNDRALRNITVGLGGKKNGIPHASGFDITVASELMAILCLAEDINDMKERFSKVIVAYTTKNKPVTAGDLHAQGAMAAIMKDALKPNLVQTLEHVPTFVHGGPFANIAHGCSSLIATKTALNLSDYVITEAGFGADLGAEKFFDIKCRLGNIIPNAVVVVATIRALKMHGGKSVNELNDSDVDALKTGLSNLFKHINNLKLYKVPLVVALNLFPSDTEEEIEFVKNACNSLNIPIEISTVFSDGGRGGISLAKKVLELAEKKSDFEFLYDENLTIKEKIKIISNKIYGAKDVEYSDEALDSLELIEKMGLDKLPVCIAKTPVSFSDDPKKLGAPEGFNIHVRNVSISAGAGFIVVLTGNVMTMPGLPSKPAAENIDIDEDGNISGLF
ncbi:formate--tetrahydrofolate ligase [Dialister micraerophilus]|uniref:Formate--tetrahydrofolate ligase n=1 Tax=Dialister micraerophilus DSM 19965 TaxID=888062 RepID=F2BVJ2_9FIRM|nr:formate--tetrahydrofolate ligase [Dialister micraerophilus]EGF16733.1 formate-tetrahydrofolate ligase [Dialister micraerophilus DSM 19965]MDK8285613.1 formate--tetrahydrofolate ligase [Dialister micraerophilus]